MPTSYLLRRKCDKENILKIHIYLYTYKSCINILFHILNSIEEEEEKY
jgi:hypothetical protein